jgi:beta-N-acetylhexosaminidase
MTIADSLRRDAGTLLWCGFEGTDAPASLYTRIGRGEVGATILFARNVAAAESGDAAWPQQVAQLVAQLRAAASVDEPHLVTIDQEGGPVQRLRAPATVWPPMRVVGATGDAARVQAVGAALGRELACLGIGADFAPVLDVDTNPDNPIIGARALSRTPDEVARLGVALARGLRSAGVLPCGKHFPGHGDTLVDSHLALPVLTHDLARMQAVELVPFREAIADGLELIMTAHIQFTALDPDVPATLSRPILQGLLREQLGFTGVIVSDDLEMKAVGERWPVEELVVRGLQAGCDAFVLCRHAELQERAFAALVDAASQDVGLRRRLGESAERVRRLKRRAAQTVPVPASPDSAARALAELVVRHRGEFAGLLG